MEKFVKELLTDDVLKEIASLYGIKKDDLYFVGGFENFIFGFEKNEKSYIVRISHSSHRTIDEIKSEIDFIFYLSNNNADVSTPIFTINNELVERVDCSDGSYFIICAFTKAEGEAPSRQTASDALFYNYGKTIGKFHKLTKDYKLASGLKKRYTWDEDILLKNAHKYLKVEDKVILDKLNDLIEKINQIEKTNNNFGLIHTDIHFGNFFVKDDKLVVFDFDDVSYQYFVSDIAIALFYLTFMLNEEDQYVFAERLMSNFMKGYLEENYLSLDDFLNIDLFLKLREYILYIVIHQTLDVEENRFAKAYISRYRDRIINDIPFINLDFKKYYINQ